MQPPPTVTVDFDVPATMRDGTVLRANVYRPAGDGRWPVLLSRTPYGKDAANGSNLVLDAVQTARRGYAVIVQDTRGTGASAGDWYPIRPEADDGADTVAWAAELPFADGQVGMFGLSYFGYTQHAAALRQPPALKAIVPIITFADPLNGVFFRGGASELGLYASWSLGMHAGVLFRRHADDPVERARTIAAWAVDADALGPRGFASLPLAEYAPFRRHDAAPAFFDTVAAPMDRTHEPASSANLVDRFDRITTPAFYVGGWYDIFIGDTIASFNALRAQGTPTKLLIGPWSHLTNGNPVGEVNFGAGAEAGFLDLKTNVRSLQLQWFDHWLKGIDTGMLAEPPVRLFVMGANVWRDEEAWPLARAIDTPWYLRAGGGLSPEPPGGEAPDRYDYDPADSVPTLGGSTLLTPEYPAGPFDQRAIEARPDVLRYASAPLPRDTEVTGPVTVHLWAVSSAPDTDFVARLVDIAPDGRSLNLTDGIVRARYRGFAAGEAPSPIEPDRPYEYAIDLWATSNLFKAGHRIGVQVTSSCFPRWDRNPNTGHPFGADSELRVAHQQILHDREHPSRVVLPVVEPA